MKIIVSSYVCILTEKVQTIAYYAYLFYIISSKAVQKLNKNVSYTIIIRPQLYIYLAKTKTETKVKVPNICSPIQTQSRILKVVANKQKSSFTSLSSINLVSLDSVHTTFALICAVFVIVYFCTRTSR